MTFAKRLVDGLSKTNHHIFRCVMLVNMQIAAGINLQVHQSVTCHQDEHMVEETDARLHVGTTLPIQIDGQRYFRFIRLAYDRSCPHQLFPQAVCFTMQSRIDLMY